MISFLKKYVNKFRYAFAGLAHGLCHDHSIALQAALGALVLAVCIALQLTAMEWCCILIVIGAVIALEYINSALETIVDMVSPQYSEGAKKSKGLCCGGSACHVTGSGSGRNYYYRR